MAASGRVEAKVFFLRFRVFGRPAVLCREDAPKKNLAGAKQWPRRPLSLKCRAYSVVSALLTPRRLAAGGSKNGKGRGFRYFLMVRRAGRSATLVS